MAISAILLLVMAVLMLKRSSIALAAATVIADLLEQGNAATTQIVLQIRCCCRGN
jgi:ABC-type enterobactin transport system permease subunit